PLVPEADAGGRRARLPHELQGRRPEDRSVHAPVYLWDIGLPDGRAHLPYPRAARPPRPAMVRRARPPRGRGARPEGQALLGAREPHRARPKGVPADRAAVRVVLPDRLLSRGQRAARRRRRRRPSPPTSGIILQTLGMPRASHLADIRPRFFGTETK